jgi:intergrase/recombinase
MVSIPSFSGVVIDYFAVKDNFVAWLRGRELNWEHSVESMLRYLEKYAKPIREPMDLVNLFKDLTNSQKRHLKNGLRNIFNFYEVQGLADKEWLDLLRKNLPRTSVGVDLKVPNDEEIAGSITKLKSTKYFALYNLILDSISDF